jgi:glutamine---fructose-6-phosphate transaminase (isomerizing)
VADTATTTQLERAIRSQPDELRRLLDVPLPMATIDELGACERLWLVGTGTSQHAAELGASMLSRAGRIAVALSSMRFVTDPPPLGIRDGVIVISHNAGAETAYAWTAHRTSVDARRPVLPITRRGGGIRGALETVDQERSHTYTVSYTAALLLLARLAHALGAEAYSPDVLARIPDAVSASLADPRTDAIRQPARLMVLFGEGPAGVTAREGSLKLREASRFPAEGYDVEFLLHGNAVPLTSEDHLIALGPPDTDGLTEGVARAAEAEGTGVTRVTEPADLPPNLAQIPLVVRLQLLALRFAAERRQNPDIVIERAWADEGLWSIGVRTD